MLFILYMSSIYNDGSLIGTNLFPAVNCVVNVRDKLDIINHNTRTPLQLSKTTVTSVCQQTKDLRSPGKSCISFDKQRNCEYLRKMSYVCISF